MSDTMKQKKRWFLITELIVLVSLLFASFVCAQESSLSVIVEEAMPSVVQIIVYDITGTCCKQGTGFFIEADKILTNAHVVDKAYSIEIISDMEYYDEITILKSDEDNDLALISVDIPSSSFLTFEPEPQLRAGHRIVTIGNPMGLEKTVSDGLISSIRVFDDTQYIQISAPISHGSSGGPLLNERGHVIGITSAGYEEGQNLNFAVGIETINNFLKRPNNPQHLHPAGSKVMWRIILKWVYNVIFYFIYAVFGESGFGIWFIFIIVMLLSFIVWVIKGLWNLTLAPLFRKCVKVKCENKNNFHSDEDLEEKLPEQPNLLDEGKTKREDFVLFLSDCVQKYPSINLEKALNQYIKKYNLAVRHNLDEPAVVADARTKLHIIEESDLVDPKYFYPDEQFQHYVETLRRTVDMFDLLPPEVSNRMKEKEYNSR